MKQKVIDEKFKHGYVKLCRSTKRHWLWSESHIKSKFEAWVDLLMRVNHMNGKSVVGLDFIVVNRGQILTSQEKLANDWRWDRSTVKKFLQLLEKDEMILFKTTSKYTMITVCNYERYNGSATGEQHQDNIKTTSTQHQDNIKTTHSRMEENGENGKNGKNGREEVTKIEEKPLPDSRLPFLEYFIRATSDIPKNILLKEIGKFLNKYPEVENPKKSIKLINAWCSRIEYTPPEKYSGMTDVKALVKKLYGDR